MDSIYNKKFTNISKKITLEKRGRPNSCTDNLKSKIKFNYFY